LRLLFFALEVVLSRSSPDKAKMRRCRILERRFRRVDMEFSRHASLFAGMLRIGASANAR